MRISLKKFIPVYVTGNKLCVGFVYDHPKYLELENTKANRKFINNLLEFGYPKYDIKANYILSHLDRMGFLEIIHKEHNNDNRNYSFFEYITNTKPDLSHLSKRILIFGSGGGGSTLVYQLAQFGFKNLFVVDDDIVSENDVLRNFPFSVNDIGTKKVDALQRKIYRNFKIKIGISYDMPIGKHDLEKYFKDYNPDLVVKACDPKGLFINNLNMLCFERNLPFLSIAYSFEKLKIGPFFIPKVTSCFNAVSKRNVKNYGNHYKVELFERPFEKYLHHPSIMFNINILSSLAFKEIMFYCFEKYEFCQTFGRLLVFDPLTFRTRGINYKCDDSCNVCSHLK